MKLKSLVDYSESKIGVKELFVDNYVGVDNLLQNCMGKVNSNFLPQKGVATIYNRENILLSNIRPYLKKIWFADNDGGASNDVLVLKVISKEIMPKYLYYYLARDNFFDFEMINVKGVKMPRADKGAILNYSVPLPPLEKQKEIVAEIEQYEKTIAEAQNKLNELEQSKKEILKKYLD